MGKEAVKKSQTLIGVIGPATSPITNFPLITVPERDVAGQPAVIRDSQNIGVDANVGDIVKYINVRIQTGPDDATPEDDTSGWLEWAIVKYREGFRQLPSSQTGVSTIGDIATRTFRGDCLLHGAIPVGGDQPSVLDIALKVPKVAQKMQMGSRIELFVYFRSTNSASVSTSLNDIALTTYYKLYV